MSQFIADFHLHSTASDGELDPQQLMVRCKSFGLESVALTDHDSIAGVELAQTTGKEIGLEVFSGCEFTADYCQVELHFLGIGFDTSEHSSAVQLIQTIKMGRPKRLLDMTDKIRGLGIALTHEEVLQEVQNTTAPGRVHLASALLKKGYVKSISEAFLRYLNPGAPAYLPKIKLTPKQVIEAIHQSGGVAILAHPGQYGCDDRIPDLFRYRLDGLEAYHHSHDSACVQRYTLLARKYGGIISGGSDYHGPIIKPGIEVRVNGLNHEMLKDFKERHAQRFKTSKMLQSV